MKEFFKSKTVQGYVWAGGSLVVIAILGKLMNYDYNQTTNFIAVMGFLTAWQARVRAD